MSLSNGWISCANTSPVSQAGCVDASHAEHALACRCREATCLARLSGLRATTRPRLAALIRLRRSSNGTLTAVRATNSNDLPTPATKILSAWWRNWQWQWRFAFRRCSITLQEVPKWIYEMWDYILRGSSHLKRKSLSWLNMPQMMRLTITTYNVLKMLGNGK
jgi:hypothetical protein